MSGRCDSSVVLYPDVEQIDLHCELPAGHEGRCRDDDSTWEVDSFGLGDLETHRWDSEPVPVAEVRWRISKGRPEWRATLPDRPWVLTRRTPYRDGGDWATVTCCPTWQVALAELALDADLIAAGIR